MVRTGQTNLSKVLAHVIIGAREIMAEWARVPSLARTLTEELARNVGGICSGSQHQRQVRTGTRLGLTLLSGRAARAIESCPRTGGGMHLAVDGAVRASRRNIQRSGTHVSKL